MADPRNLKEAVLSKRRRSEVTQLSVVSNIESYQKQRIHLFYIKFGLWRNSKIVEFKFK